MKIELETDRLILIPCDKKIVEAALQGDDALKKLLQIKIPEKWTEYGNSAFEFTLKKLIDDPASVGWWAYLPVFKEGNILIGTCGYKGPPDKDGVVEIGYQVAEAYRGLGFAKEIAKGLIVHAFKNNNVNTVRAHTLAEENASVKVLLNCGMLKVAELDDPEDGRIWRWEIEK